MKKTPQHPVEQAFVRAVEACDFTPRRWLIGFSGGLDSQVLAHLAVSFLPSAQLRLVHVNHGLQDAAAGFEQHCRNWAAAHACELDVVQVQPESTSEEAARNARYQAFEAVVSKDDLLLLGQHADDQAETLLFRMVRGTGLKGLAGMPVQRALGAAQLMRPLLRVSRADLEAYALEQGLSWVEDPTNTDTGYSRNYLRHRVLAPLTARWPQAVSRIAALSRRLAQQQALLEEVGRDDLVRISGCYAHLSLAGLQALSLPRRINVLQVWLAQWQLTLSEKLLSELAQQLEAGQDRQPQLILSDASQLRRFNGALFRVPHFHAECLDKPLALNEEGLEFSQGYLLVRNRCGEGLKSLEGLTVRYRQPGDKIWLAERGIHQSIKNFFQERSIPPWLRDHWPLIFAGDELVAVAGLYTASSWQVEQPNERGFAIIWQSFGLSEGGCFAIL